MKFEMKDIELFIITANSKKDFSKRIERGGNGFEKGEI